MAVDEPEPPDIPVAWRAQLAMWLHMAHQGASAPEYRISAEAAQALSDSLCNFGRYYMRLAVMSPRGQALMALIGTAGMVYGPATLLYAARKREENGTKAEPPQRPPNDAPNGAPREMVIMN